MGFQDEYAQLAPYYRAFAKSRGHFDQQAELVMQLIRRLELGNPKVLDAACGTGDVAVRLLVHGLDVWCTDGSAQMVEEARREFPFLERMNILERKLWTQLDGLFSRQKFDLILVLGNSLAHASRADIPAILRQFLGGLREDGVLCLDCRRWVHDVAGSLVEPDRPVGVSRWLGEYCVANRQCWIDDTCSYDDGLQKITYAVTHSSEEHRHFDFECTLLYTPFEIETLHNWLLEAGFGPSATSFMQCVQYPYLIATARAD